MNKTEKSMLEILQEGREEHGFLAVKAEFEAEGTRHDEFLRLLHIARIAQVKVALKIGGCEAVRDLIEAKQYGVDYIIAPMIETPYALQKFIDAKNKVYLNEEQGSTHFLFNLETKTGYDNRLEMVRLASSPKGVNGVVFGRVDFAGSLGKNRDAVDGEEIMGMVQETAKLCVSSSLDLVVGGAVSTNSIDALKKVKDLHLSRYETRKVVFSSSNLTEGRAEKAIQLAGRFELLWLENKKDYYQALAMEDEKRLQMLRSRFS